MEIPYSTMCVGLHTHRHDQGTQQGARFVDVVNQSHELYFTSSLTFSISITETSCIHTYGRTVDKINYHVGVFKDRSQQ